MNKIAIILFLGLLLSCTDRTNQSVDSVNNLSEKIEYKDEISVKVISENEGYKMILFAIKKDQVLEPHSAPMDTPLLILKGSAKITVGTEEHRLYEGDLITLPKDIDHGVYPMTDVKFLLIK